VAVLETPAGFEPNSELVANRWAQALRRGAPAPLPEVTVVPARRRGGPDSPDEPAVVVPILAADVIALGPGSPTYAVRQLSGSLAWSYAEAGHWLGASLLLASASAIAIGACALPVYEIYKVGSDLHWTTGLDLLGPYGLRLAVIPHWNNREGGAHLDTSCCYMGARRFAALRAQLPEDITVVGLDEHTALVIDLQTGLGHVLGQGSATIIREHRQQAVSSGEQVGLDLLGSPRVPELTEAEQRWPLASVRAARDEAARPATAPDDVRALVQERARARERGDWQTADQLRMQIAAAGWQVDDTPHGPRLAQPNRPPDATGERVGQSPV
jgi:hypothetical protein